MANARYSDIVIGEETQEQIGEKFNETVVDLSFPVVKSMLSDHHRKITNEMIYDAAYELMFDGEFGDYSTCADMITLLAIDRRVDTYDFLSELVRMADKGQICYDSVDVVRLVLKYDLVKIKLTQDQVTELLDRLEKARIED